MYFPYLRGRQFELIALREFAIQRKGLNNVIPIIEPVKKTFNSLKIAISKFKESGLTFALILNPQVGEISDFDEIFNNLEDELEDASWIPTFIVKQNNAEIEDIIESLNLSDVMLICSESVDTSTDEFFNFATSENISYIVSKENRILKRKLRSTKINLIRLDSCFNPQKRNKDYLSVREEKFSDEHLFYSEDRYFGFSDYTTLPDEYSEGGTTPFAISIHLTFQKENDEIWIRHFTSETNDDQANIQGKFAEAAEKAIQFLNVKNIHNYATNELREYFGEQKYPGLGTVKKISIKNHLELVNSIL